jgi:hypothetical protein
LIDVIVTASVGATVSTANPNPLDDPLSLPAGSTLVAVTECVPSPRSLAGVNVQPPDAFAVVDPISVPLS